MKSENNMKERERYVKKSMNLVLKGGIPLLVGYETHTKREKHFLSCHSLDIPGESNKLGPFEKLLFPFK